MKKDKLSLAEEGKIDFLFASISDIQSTIRAFDTKILAIIVLIALPIYQIKLLNFIFHQLICTFSPLGYFLLISFILSWFISFIFFILCVLSIDNPVEQIKNDCNVLGVFYGSNIFNFRFKNLIFFRPMDSKPLLSEHLDNLSRCDLEKELVYEYMKLVYIRDLKSKRQKITIISISVTLSIAIVSWLIINVV